MSRKLKLVPKQKRVIDIQMIVPATVNIKTASSITPESSCSKERYKVTLPAYDGEDAKRLARALNEQTRLCGGQGGPVREVR